MVLVTWEDAAVMDSETWVNDPGDNEPKTHIHQQVGFLLKKTRTAIVLTATWSPEMVSARDSIPIGMVRSIEYLDPRKSARKKA